MDTVSYDTYELDIQIEIKVLNFHISTVKSSSAGMWTAIQDFWMTYEQLPF